MTSINVAQIKMLSAFYFFTSAKNNTTMPIHESGRMLNETSNVLNIISSVIRDGTYDATSLPAELNNQLNKAPIYSVITKNDFFNKFRTSGNYALLFSDIGNSTYNNLTQNFDLLNDNPSISTVMLPNYGDIDYKQTDPSGVVYLQGTNYYNQIIYNFTSLNDPYISLIVSDINNQTILDKYKAANSWNSCLLNNYNVQYNNQTGLIKISAASLNTSLVTTFNNYYDSIKYNELWKVSINPSLAGTIQENISNANYSFNGMYNFLQNTYISLFYNNIPRIRNTEKSKNFTITLQIVQ